MSDPIIVSDDGPVRVIRLNRLDKKNALTQEMYAAMTRALRDAGANESIRCVVIAGGQGVFSAGADIGEFMEAAETGGLRTHTLDFLKSLAHSQKPLVAAVSGLAVGIGVTMLFHCDYVVAAAMRRSLRRFSNWRCCRRRDRVCLRRCAWVTRAPSPCWSWVGR
jgi:enoyl-CoA hydratase/carnithine racemase